MWFGIARIYMNLPVRLLPGTASLLHNVTISRLVTGDLLFCQFSGYDCLSLATICVNQTRP